MTLTYLLALIDKRFANSGGYTVEVSANAPNDIVAAVGGLEALKRLVAETYKDTAPAKNEPKQKLIADAEIVSDRVETQKSPSG